MAFWDSGNNHDQSQTKPNSGSWINRLRIVGRRAAHFCHNMVVGRRYTGPISFLAVSAALGLALTVTTLYTTSYAVYVDGESLGIVANQSTVTDAVNTVEQRGSNLLGYSYQVDNDISYEFALSLRTDLTSSTVFENYFFNQLTDVGNELRRYEVSLDGQVVGVVAEEAGLNELLNELKAAYMTENTISAEFVEELTVRQVYQYDTVIDLETLRGILTENTTGETTYTVQKGDTFNAIAYANDMSVSELKALNPGVNINVLMIGDVLNVKEIIPRLSVATVERVTYNEVIPSPVEEIGDNTIYVGSSKILSTGTAGEAQVTANVSCVNGKEIERQVVSSVTLKAPTVTKKAVGTLPKPKTASNGYYIWPCSGRISSYFGSRVIFGEKNYHSGIDIAAAKGTAIKAADGGKVTFSGNKGNYGLLVVVTHDDGTQTYYGHCSALLVSAGERVYQGQTIAKVGSTGRSTGNHCHFEIRIKNKAVNPLNYLPDR